MTATFDSLGFGGPEFDLDNDLPGALRGGLESLHLAAAERGVREETVAAVIESAFNPFCEFVAGQVDGYNEVVEVALSVNGWAWTDACLAAPERRWAEFQAVRKQCVRYAAKHFPALHKHDREEAVDDLLSIELAGPSGRWFYSTVVDAKLPGWTIPGIVYYRLPLRLQDAKAKHVDRHREIRSWEGIIESRGEHEPSVRPMWDVPVDDAGIEAVVWAAALVNLTDRAATMIQSARAGSARDKVTLTVEAAKWVLARGAEDSLNQHGEPLSGSAEELRQKYCQDSLLVSFQGLRAAAPRRWGAYPETAVPTRDVIERVATEAKARGDVNAAWFACLEARRVEVAKSDRVLHGVRRLVESLIEEAARDTGV